jgi:hypothetical protein
MLSLSPPLGFQTLSRLALQAGEEHKEKGNQAFHEGRFREAMLCYNNALDVCPVGPSAVTYLVRV